ncbi:MAG: aminotransferase class V-fold PLP-dependent enzyme [Defluviitaleaceae bacterium]|nr:aminotransferase class V-fold PLP-dependent enzyme [Defluviitaleaceae bacterium]
MAAFIHAEKLTTGNANARHTAGQTARVLWERTTRGISAFMGSEGADLIHVSGASEGNVRAITGLAQAYRHQGRHILSTCYAHPSENAALASLTEQGYEIDHVRIKQNGLIDLAHLEASLRVDTILLCISAVDSELGVVQPLEEIAGIIRAHANGGAHANRGICTSRDAHTNQNTNASGNSHAHCHLHIDAAQAVGKVPLPSFDALGASTMTFSAHKFYGVGGSGVLLCRRGVVLDGVYDGGTPAPGLAAACHAALDEALREMTVRTAHVAKLHKKLTDALAQYPQVRINSPVMPAHHTTPRNPYILNLSVANTRGTAFRDALNRHRVCVSVKAACATDQTPSRPVQAISDKKNALSSWRISLSHLTTPEEIDAFLHIFHTCHTELTAQ